MMKSIRLKRYLLFLLLSCLGLATAYAENLGTHLNITEDYVKSRCTIYINELLKDETPSVAFFYMYHGSHDESEYGAELNYCYQQWGEPFRCEDGKLSITSKCSQYLTRLDEYSEKTSSLYLSEVQKILRQHKGKFRITSAKLERQDNNGSAYLIIGTIGNAPIQLQYTVYNSMGDDGWLNISKINNRDLKDLLSSARYSVPACSK